MNEITREMQRLGKTKVIIVTSPPHIRRVRTLWKRLAARQNQAIVRAAFEDLFDADHWWRNTRGTFFRSPGNHGLGKRLDRTSRAAQLAMTASGIASRMLGTHIKGQRIFIRFPLAWCSPSGTRQCKPGWLFIGVRLKQFA